MLYLYVLASLAYFSVEKTILSWYYNL